MSLITESNASTVSSNQFERCHSRYTDAVCNVCYKKKPCVVNKFRWLGEVCDDCWKTVIYSLGVGFHDIETLFTVCSNPYYYTISVVRDKISGEYYYYVSEDTDGHGNGRTYFPISEEKVGFYLHFAVHRIKSLVNTALRGKGFDICEDNGQNGGIDCIAVRKDKKIYIQYIKNLSLDETDRQKHERLLEIGDSYPKYLVYFENSDKASVDNYEHNGVRVYESDYFKWHIIKATDPIYNRLFAGIGDDFFSNE